MNLNVQMYTAIVLDTFLDAFDQILEWLLRIQMLLHIVMVMVMNISIMVMVVDITSMIDNITLNLMFGSPNVIKVILLIRLITVISLTLWFN